MPQPGAAAFGFKAAGFDFPRRVARQSIPSLFLNFHRLAAVPNLFVLSVLLADLFGLPYTGSNLCNSTITKSFSIASKMVHGLPRFPRSPVATPLCQRVKRPWRNSGVFNLIADEYRDKGLTLPSDTTEIVNA